MLKKENKNIIRVPLVEELENNIEDSWVEDWLARIEKIIE